MKITMSVRVSNSINKLVYKKSTYMTKLHKTTIIRPDLAHISFSYLDADISDYVRKYLEQSKYQKDIEISVSDCISNKHFGIYNIIGREAITYVEQSLAEIFGKNIESIYESTNTKIER